MDSEEASGWDIQWLWNLISEFERTRCPFLYRIYGFSLWPKLRFLTYEMLREQLGTYTPRPGGTQSGILRKSIEKALQLPRGLVEIRKIRGYQKHSYRKWIIAFTSTDRLQANAGRTFRNRCFDFFDPPLQDLIAVYDINTKHAALYADTRPFLESSLVEVWRLAEALRHPLPSQGLRSLFQEFSCFMSNSSWPVLPPKLFKRWQIAEWSFRAQFAASRYLVESLHPRLVLIDTGYGREGTIAAAKSVKIPTWEVQHGLVWPLHMGYIYDQESIPSKRCALPFPDRFFSYGDYSLELMQASGYCEANSILSLGSAQMEYFKRTVPRPSWDRRPFRVLLSNQWIYSSALVDYLKRVVAHIPEGIEFAIKPHPQDSQDIVRKFEELGKSITVLSRHEPIYKSFRNIHLHAAVSSTTLFESIGLSIPTVVLALPGWQAVSTLVESNAAVLCNDAGDFSTLFSQLAADRGRYDALVEQTRSASSYYWAPDPALKFHALLTEIL